MSGFNISIGSVGKIIKSRETHTIKNDFIAYKDIRLNNSSNYKFNNDNLFLETIDRITNGGLKSDCQNLYNLGNATEKNQVLTLLSAIKLNF